MGRVIGRLALCVLLLSGPAMTAAEDESMSLGEVRRLAEQGDASAQYNLGVRYDFGEGVPADAAEAVKWYRLAAEQGHASAQYDLGVRYANGKGVPQDDAEAVKWYRLAAAGGIASAQYNLGFMYANGRGVPQDAVEAVKWYRLAAEQGHDGAQIALKAGSVEKGLELSLSDRRLIQMGLAAEGFDPGPADGLFGPRTRKAIELLADVAPRGVDRLLGHRVGEGFAGVR